MRSNFDPQLGGLVDRIKAAERETVAARASAATVSQAVRERQIDEGRLYAEAHKRVEEGEAGDISWKQWCRQVLDINSREANRKIGYCMDPKKLTKRRTQMAAKCKRQRDRGGRPPRSAVPAVAPRPRPLTPEDRQGVSAILMAWNETTTHARRHFKDILLRANTDGRIDY